MKFEPMIKLLLKMEISKGSHSCCVCGHIRKPSFQFPNPKRFLDKFDAWRSAVANPKHLHLTNEEIFKRSFVCVDHFRSTEDVVTNGPVKLKKNAVPTVNLQIERCSQVLQSNIDYEPSTSCNATIILNISSPPKEYRDILNVSPRKRITLVPVQVYTQSNIPATTSIEPHLHPLDTSSGTSLELLEISTTANFSGITY